MLEFSPVRYFKTRLVIGLSDIDTAGFVYHGNYYHLYNRARDDFFRNLGYPYSELMEAGLHLGVAHIDCKYLKPLEYDEIIDIETGILWIKSRAVGVRQRIIREKDGEICNDAEITFVCIDADVRAVEMPERFRRIIGEWGNGN